MHARQQPKQPPLIVLELSFCLLPDSFHVHRADGSDPPPVQASSFLRDRSQSAIEGKVSARTTLKPCHGTDADFSESVCK
jgi:hypothetical protein